MKTNFQFSQKLLLNLIAHHFNFMISGNSEFATQYRNY